MRRKALVLCAVSLSLIMFAACGKNKTNDNTDIDPTPPPENTQNEESSINSFGKYEVKTNSEDTLVIKITPDEGQGDAETIETQYTFEDDTIVGVKYTNQYSDAEAAKKAYDELLSKPDSYENVTVSENVITYNVSKSSIGVYSGMTRQDIVELTKILNGKIE